jgi:hypothetical protein
MQITVVMDRMHRREQRVGALHEVELAIPR